MNLQKHAQVRVDWVTIVLIGLMQVFLTGSILLADALNNSPTTTQQTTDATLPFWMFGLVILEVLGIVALWRLYGYIPDRWQRRLKKVAVYGTITVAYYTGFLIYYSLDLAVAYVIAVPILWVAAGYLKSSGTKWIVFNIVALCIGMIAVAIFSNQLSPLLVVILMVLFSIYDYLAVDLSNIMGDLVEFSASLSIPNFLVIPNQFRVELEPLFEYMKGESEAKPENIATVIGLGDFIFPTLLLASITVQKGTYYAPELVGATAGLLLSIPILRAALIRREKATPALPWLNSGAIFGYAFGSLVSVVAVL